MNSNSLTPNQIRDSLRAHPFEPRVAPFPLRLLNRNPRLAAVLIPLVHETDGWHVLFIRRTEVEGDVHSGQVALPGGGKDREDPSLAAAALREAHEELAINPADVKILGQLNEHIAISNYRVTPFVGTLPWPYPLVRQEQEVARWFTIPLTWLAAPDNHTVKPRKLPLGMGEFGIIYFDKYDGELLWGLSAQIIMEFIEVLDIRDEKRFE
jgi:8-oxo-dGTP pyrophosphatase MutT (NUDIX family)